MTLPWIIAGAAAGLMAGPRIRASVLTHSTGHADPARRACPTCSCEIIPARARWRAMLPPTGRCPACRARIGPHAMSAEFAAALAVAIVVARSASAPEAAALTWLCLAAVPLAFIDLAVRRLPDALTAAALVGTMSLLAVAAFTGHQPGSLLHAVAGGAALPALYLAMAVIRPGGMGFGDVKLAASAGAALGWFGWHAAASGTFAAFALGTCYIGATRVLPKTRNTRTIPMGPFILLGALTAIAL